MPLRFRYNRPMRNSKRCGFSVTACCTITNCFNKEICSLPLSWYLFFKAANSISATDFAFGGFCDESAKLRMVRPRDNNKRCITYFAGSGNHLFPTETPRAAASKRDYHFGYLANYRTLCCSRRSVRSHSSVAGRFSRRYSKGLSCVLAGRLRVGFDTSETS